MMCKDPKFISIKKEMDKGLNELKFSCPNSDLGCDKALIYSEAMIHD